MVPNFAYMEKKYNVSRRVLQRSRAKLARLGLIEHISYLNSRYGGQHGWKLSSRFEQGLTQLAQKCTGFRKAIVGTLEKDLLLLEFMNTKRGIGNKNDQICLGDVGRSKKRICVK